MAIEEIDNINDTFTSYIDDYKDDIQFPDKDGLTPLDKNYLRILFKPGYSIQSRELNQVQSLLQAQIDRFGKRIFKTNQPIFAGEVNFDSELYWVKITANLSFEDIISSFQTHLETVKLSQNIAGTTGPMIAVPTKIENLQPSEAEDLTTFRIYFHYLTSSVSTTTDPPENISEFSNGGIQLLNYNEDATTILNDINCNIIESGRAVAAKVNPGFYFVRGCAAQIGAQYVTKLLVDPEILYTGYIILKITENKITHLSDETLLDNAAVGENEDGNLIFNEAFIGADRYQIVLTLDIVDSLENQTGEFVQLKDIVDSEVVRESDSDDNSQALRELFAARTYEESGNYTVEPFRITLNELYNNPNAPNDGLYNNTLDLKQALGYDNANSISDAQAISDSENFFAVTLSPGVSYIQGYRAELNESLNIINKKTLDTYRSVNNKAYFSGTNADIGNFVEVTIADGLPEFDAYGTTYTIYNGALTPVQIGTCKIQSVEALGGNRANLYLHDIKLTNGKFGDAVTIEADNELINNDFGGSYGQPVFTIVEPVLNDAQVTGSLYKLSMDLVRSVESLEVYEKKSAVSTLDGDLITPEPYAYYTVSGTNGEEFVKDRGELLVAYFDFDAGPGNQGEWITLSYQDFTIQLGQSNTELTVLLQNAFAVGGSLEGVSPEPVDKVRVIYGVKSNLTGDRGTKRFTEQSISITLSDIINFVPDTGRPTLTNFQPGDIVELNGIYHLNDIESAFDTWEIIDDGQHDTEYVNAKLRCLRTIGATSTSLDISYWAFEGTGKNFYTVNSYITANGSQVNLRDIPTYKDKPLNDYLDLRLKPNSTDRIVLDPYSSINCDIDFYLPRRDLIVVNTNRRYLVVNGIPDLDPQYPNLPSDSMPIASMDIPGYMYNGVNSVSVKIVDNKRYTMEDIGILEDRIDKLEYYATLSLLEKSAADISIYADDGEERFKNGFVVDGFRGHDVGYPRDPNYRCSIARRSGILYPHHESFDIPFEMSNLTDIQANESFVSSGDNRHTLSLRYNNVLFTEQLLATQSSSVQPHEVFASPGDLQLYPEEDTFVDVTDRPAVSIDPLAGVNDAIRFLSEATGVLGTEWEEWQTINSTLINTSRSTSRKTSTSGSWTPRGGRPVRTTKTTVTTTNTFADDQVRTGIETYIDDQQRLDMSLGRYVSDIQIIPWMRSREVFFRASGLKPNTRFYAFFDQVNVTDWCTPLGLDSVVPVPRNETTTTSSARTIRRLLIENPDAIMGPELQQWFDDNPNVVLSESNIESYWNRELEYIFNAGDIRIGSTNVDHEDVLRERNPFGALISNSIGELQGMFIVPSKESLRFAAGEKRFKLTNSPRNLFDEETSFATSRFISNGIAALREEKIINSRIGRITTREVDDARTINRITRSSSSRSSRQYYDPVAQSFRVDDANGICVTEAEIWFDKKPTGENAPPVQVYLVTMENGYPTDKIIPGSMSTVQAADVVEARDPSERAGLIEAAVYRSNGPGENAGSTTFKFESPIYLYPNENYALVVYSSSPEYFIYVADLGGQDIVTNRIVSTQANIGIFFTSSNKITWSANQNRDMTFRLKKAEFDTSATITAIPRVQETVGDVQMISGGTGYTIDGTNITFGAPFTYVPDPNNPGGQIEELIDGGVAATGVASIDVNTGEILDIIITSPGAGYQYPPTITIEDENNPTNTTANAQAILKKVDISAFLLNQRVVNIGSATSISNNFTLNNIGYNIIGGQIVENLRSTNHYINSSNDQNNILTITMSTNDPNVSPLLDKNTLALNTRKYYVDSINTLDETKTSRYITRRITLNNPGDQLDGYLSINRPSEAANLRVYAQLYNENNDVITVDGSIDGSEWWEIPAANPLTIPVNSIIEDYKDVRFTRNFESASDAYPTGLEFSSFRIKIVLYSSNIVEIPRVKSLRFIASS